MISTLSAVLFSPPRLAASLGGGLVFAIDRLWFQGSLLAGAPLVALTLVSAAVGFVLYLVATVCGWLGGPIALRLGASRRLAEGGGFVIGCAGLATLGRLWTGERAWLALGMLAVAIPFAFAIDRLWSRLHRRPSLQAALGLTLVVGLFAWVPITLYRPHSSRFQLDLDGQLPPTDGARQILLVGVDGADWHMMGELMNQGRLPALRALADDGVSMPLHTLRPTSSPFLWNAIYSGFTPALHELRPVAHAPYRGMRIATRETGRIPDAIDATFDRLGTPAVRVPFAMWDILRARGYRTDVIGAWEREPVPHVGRSFAAVRYEFPAVAAPERRIHTHVSPALWADDITLEGLETVETRPIDVPLEEWQRLVGTEYDVEQLLNAQFDGNATPAEIRLARLRNVYASDRIRMHMARRALERDAAKQFTFVYFRGVDVVKHCYLHRHLGHLDPAEAGLADVVEAYYDVVDEWIGELRSLIRDDAVMLVVSDHGFDPNQHRDHVYKTGFHDYAPEGVFLSNRVRDGEEPPAAGAHILDVAPTVLTLAGLPIDAAMEGTVLEIVTERTYSVDDWWSLRPAEYERGNPALSNPELESYLKSLGYL